MTRFATVRWFLPMLLPVAMATAQVPQPGLGLGPGWVQLGRQHVRDGAETDLAVLATPAPMAEIRVCAEGQAVRVRNAVAWLPGGGRQKLWLPLVIDANRCSKAIRVDRGPRRVTHIAFEYEALSLGMEGAHLVITGRRVVERPL